MSNVSDYLKAQFWAQTSRFLGTVIGFAALLFATGYIIILLMATSAALLGIGIYHSILAWNASRKEVLENGSR
jgi:hypothetical protein